MIWLIIKNFYSNSLKIDKELYKDIVIYYIGYITTKNFDDFENIHSVNPLYLIIHSTTGHFKENNGEKYLIIYSTEKYEEIWYGIRSEIKTLNGGKNIDDDLPLNKQLKFSTLTIIIRCLLQNGENLYPQIYLDECLYELVV